MVRWSGRPPDALLPSIGAPSDSKESRAYPDHVGWPSRAATTSPMYGLPACASVMTNAPMPTVIRSASAIGSRQHRAWNSGALENFACNLSVAPRRR